MLSLRRRRGVFHDASTGASETSFGAISLTITADLDGIHDDLSLLACLNTGGGCVFGNQLDASFQILAADLNSHNAPATGLDQPHPLDFLEDDGVTDIQRTVSAYSYTSGVPGTPGGPGPAAVREPSTLALLGIALAGMAGKTFAARRAR
jgi:hypothetical protein